MKLQFGFPDASESQHLTGKGVKCKLVNAMAKCPQRCIFLLQTEHSLAGQIFVVGRVGDGVFDDSVLNSRLRITQTWTLSACESMFMVCGRLCHGSAGVLVG